VQKVLTPGEVRFVNENAHYFVYAMRVLAGDRMFDPRALRPARTYEGIQRPITMDEWERLLAIAGKLAKAV
jgi:hypothetical protein